MSVEVNIGSKLDAKGFKQADTAINKLNKGTKSLARNFGLAFGTAAIIAFGKKAVQAAAADEAAQASLAQTLKNLGYESVGTAQSINTFISSLERETGILDDELRPAMDRLLRATGSVTKSQELMSLALDISAGTGKDLGQVSQSLQKAYLGQTQALGRLGVGLSKAELASSNFEEITARLSTLFEGQASRQADSYKGSMDKLAVASNNVSEAIGIGIIDALKLLSDDGSIESVTVKMEDLGTKIGEAITGTASLLKKFQQFTSSNKQESFIIDGQEFKLAESLLDQLAAEGRKATGKKIFGGIYATKYQQQANAAAEKLATEYAKKQAALAKKKADEEKKALNAKRLSNAIDKANLLLGKANDVFDIDKIQANAALINQAELLGKATDAAQILQIANDTARLNVKRSILALEDAIAAKDEAAIAAATAKLNEDLKILGALSMQKTQMVAIESILKGLAPKDLINQNNLDEALRKIREMLALLGQVKAPTLAPATGGRDLSTPEKVAAITAKLPASVTATDFFNSLTEDEQAQLGGYKPFVGANIPTAPTMDFGPSGVGLGNNGSGRQVPVQANYSITVNAGVGDPEAIARALEDYIRSANQRGTTSLTLA